MWHLGFASAPDRWDKMTEELSPIRFCLIASVASFLILTEDPKLNHNNKGGFDWPLNCTFDATNTYLRFDLDESPPTHPAINQPASP